MGKLEGLKSNDIGQSAAKPRIGEGSTTIPEGSTLTMSGNGSSQVYIYSLADPKTLEIRYVGKTKYPLKDRLAKHLCAKDKSYRTNWIQSILKRGEKPIIQLVEVTTTEEWISREQY